ncbi:MAG: TSUP family transporter [Lachnospiraceae bacterium]|nr:TSUP family transporter [Lachnospiraceae bacterium]
MELQLQTFLIVCPLVFLAGFVDAVAGGGGLISLPAYFIAGVPIHNAIATNKLSSATGTAISTIRYIRHAVIPWKIALPTIALTFVGSSLGARISLILDERILKGIMIVVLPIVAFFVLRKNSFLQEGKEPLSTGKTAVITMTAGLVIGCYDGLYGPGTGTFLLIILMGVAHMDMMSASGMTKIINLTSNISALIAFLFHGQVYIVLGLVASFFSIAGHYTGSGMVLKNGMKIVRPIILVVLCLLFLKIVTEF